MANENAKGNVKAEEGQQKPATENKFFNAMHFIFVHNIALKGTAVLLGLLTFIILSVF